MIGTLVIAIRSYVFKYTTDAMKQTTIIRDDASLAKYRYDYRGLTKYRDFDFGLLPVIV